MEKQQTPEEWAQEQAPGELSRALNAVSMVARQPDAAKQKKQTIIPLKVTIGVSREVLLAEMVVVKLQKFGFVVFEKNDTKIKEYFVVWGKDFLAPEGFKLISSLESIF